MRKIPSLFVRDWDGDKRLVTPVVTPGCEWVVAGEGQASRKWDGTACLVRGGKLFKRYDCKPGKKAPAGWEACEEAADPITKHWPGWVPVGDGPDDKWHREGWEHREAAPPGVVDRDGTYELVGPAINTNPEHRDGPHVLIRHGTDIWVLDDPPRDFAGLKAWFETHVVEGIVWWRNPSDQDCEKVKIKRRDFGLEWPVKQGA